MVKRHNEVHHLMHIAPMPIEPFTAAGKEVTLEPLLMSHAKVLYEGVQQGGALQHLAPESEDSLRQFEKWIGRRIAEMKEGTALAFMIRGKQSGRPIGCTSMFNMSARHHRLEIGHTWIRREWRGSKANPESKLLLMTQAFEEMDAVRVQFKVDTRNDGALLALERIGAVREGKMRNERILNDGFIRDAYVYSIIKREWPEVKKALNEMVWG